MYHAERNERHIGIFDNFFEYHQSHELINLKKKTLQRVIFLKRNLSLLKIKKWLFNLFWASKQHICCLTFKWKFLPVVMNLLNEWSIYKITIRPYKTTTFSSKFILDKVLGLDLWFYKKCFYCADKTTALVMLLTLILIL